MHHVERPLLGALRRVVGEVEGRGGLPDGLEGDIPGQPVPMVAQEPVRRQPQEGLHHHDLPLPGVEQLVDVHDARMLQPGQDPGLVAGALDVLVGAGDLVAEDLEGDHGGQAAVPREHHGPGRPGGHDLANLEPTV